MKKLNKKGFTLIELLAVIVIMGILMFVAIPAVSRTIENSRKDTFIDTAKAYANQVSTLWSSDGLQCGSSAGTLTSTSLPAGTYYVPIDTNPVDGKTKFYQEITPAGGGAAVMQEKEVTVPNLLEQGGKSSWSNKDVKGFVTVVVYSEAGVEGLKTEFYVTIVDGVHGLSNQHALNTTDSSAKPADKLVRGDVTLYNMSYDTIFGNSTTTPITSDLAATTCVEI